MKTNTDFTLYERSVINGVEKWTRFVVKDVLWENRKAANVLRSGNLQADSVAVYISIHNREVVINVGDVIVEGVLTKEISSSYRMSQLKEDHANVVTVRSVDKYAFGSPKMHHLQIGAS